MAKFLADEDFNNRIVRGVRRRSEEVDLVRVHEVGLLGEPDPIVLEWAANETRIVLTHDAATMIAFAYERIRENRYFPGMIVVSQYASIGKAIDDLERIAASDEIGLSIFPLESFDYVRTIQAISRKHNQRHPRSRIV